MRPARAFRQLCSPCVIIPVLLVNEETEPPRGEVSGLCWTPWALRGHARPPHHAASQPVGASVTCPLLTGHRQRARALRARRGLLQRRRAGTWPCPCQSWRARRGCSAAFAARSGGQGPFGHSGIITRPRGLEHLTKSSDGGCSKDCYTISVKSSKRRANKQNELK